MLRAALLWLSAAASACACDCATLPLNQARTLADVIFRGVIVRLRPAAGPPSVSYGEDTGKIAVFRVSRVWKGELGATFEMPVILETSACWGFAPDLPKPGNDLLVFAYRRPGEREGTFLFLTSICTRTALARNNRDLDALGAGYAPVWPPRTQR